ncbi:MAG: SDR family NAD(P)-dependent oxidoreductase [Anaerolineae bacterium]|nr:SDR family NAD(P)-dependent oxidoreductase [Anaerolineae bacterium]
MKPIAEQTILITGATDGLGKQTALELAKQGATILLHGRDPQRLDNTRQELQAATGSTRLEPYLADFSSLDAVHALAETIQARHPQIDTLINNAALGPGAPDSTRELSQDGYELRFAVNYLASYLLTYLLLPCLRHTPPSRIINVGSIGQYPLDFDDIMLERHYTPLNAYRQTKLALVMFTFDLADMLKDDDITVNCVHPASLMNTKMVVEGFGRTMSTVADGVASLLYLITSPALDGITGKFFDHQQEARANEQAYDPVARRQLHLLSEQLTMRSRA